MSEIAGVLLVPTDGDPWRLLAEGPCGARVPRAIPTHQPDRDWTPMRRWVPRSDLAAHIAPSSDALVLAWDGAVVREGRDRAAYVLAEREIGAPSDPLGGVGSGVTWGADNASTVYAAMQADVNGDCICWRLASDDYDDTWTYDETWARPAGLPPALVAAWALATVCAARGLGRVVLLDATGAEVTDA